MQPLETYGNYQLVEKLAVGGMAQLYLAKRRSKGAEKTVVLKRILPHLAEDTAFVTMFLDEARIAARLHHPNVIEILDLGAEGDSYFIAMEYIHGEDLRRISKRGIELGRRMPPPLVCRVVAQACRGLDYAHRRTDAQGKPLRIVHRDVSPQNILVGFDGQVKVVDFGIAKAADKATVTASGVIKGKHAYMSPEQALGRDIDHRTDVFALGIVLYETLTATRLFRRATDLQTLKAVSECKVEAPSRVFPGVPLPLDAIIMKALSKDLGQRYQRADELATDLENWLGDRPDGAVESVGKYVCELFSERLEKEKSEGKYVPTKSAVGFGLAARQSQSGGSGSNKDLPPASGGATASLRVEKKSVTELEESHLPPTIRSAPKAAALSVSPLESRATDVTPAYQPTTQPRLPDRITEPVSAVKRDKSSTELSKPHLDGVLDGEDVEPITLSGAAGGTTPYGRPLSTAMYGKLNPHEGKTLLEPPQQRIATPIAEPPPPQKLSNEPLPSIPPLEPITEAQRPIQPMLRESAGESTIPQKPQRTVMWPWWLAAGLTTVAVAAVVTKVLVDRKDLIGGVAAEAPPVIAQQQPPQPAPPIGGELRGEEGKAKAEPPKPAPVPVKPGGDVAEASTKKVPSKAMLKPQRQVPVEGATFALTTRDGQLYASLSGDPLPNGTSVRIVGPAQGGTKERDFYGVGSVVEVKDGSARILFDEGALPDGLFVTPDQVKGPYQKLDARGGAAGGEALVGALQLRQGEPKADVALKNATDFDWSQCEVRLPDNRFLKLGPSVLVKAGATQWISGGAFKARSTAQEAKQKDGFGFVKCAEGDGWLKAAFLP